MLLYLSFKFVQIPLSCVRVSYSIFVIAVVVVVVVLVSAVVASFSPSLDEICINSLSKTFEKQPFSHCQRISHLKLECVSFHQHTKHIQLKLKIAIKYHTLANFFSKFEVSLCIFAVVACMRTYTTTMSLMFQSWRVCLEHRINYNIVCVCVWILNRSIRKWQIASKW